MSGLSSYKCMKSKSQERVHVALQEAETSRQNRCLALDMEKML